jgi:hypothetical protein
VAAKRLGVPTRSPGSRPCPKSTPSGQASSRIVGNGNAPVMNFNFDGFLGKVRGEGFWAGVDLHSVDLERLSRIPCK